MYYYAFTLRKTRHPITQEDYCVFVAKLLECNPTLTIIEAHYEQTKGLHYHAMFLSNFRLKETDVRKVGIKKGNYYKLTGWSYRLNDITHYEGWMNYIRKDTKKEIINHFMATEHVRGLTQQDREQYAKAQLHIVDDSGSEDDGTEWYYKTRLV